MRSLELIKMGLSFTWPSTAYVREEFTSLQLAKIAVAGISALNANFACGAAAAVPSQLGVPTTAGGAIIAAASAVGKVVAIYNFGPYPITISDGGTPTVTDGTAVIHSGGYWERPRASISAIKAIANGGASTVTVTTY